MSSTKLKQMRQFLLKCVQHNTAKKAAERKRDRLKFKHGIHHASKPHDWEIVRGDIVEVIRGRDEGKQGKVTQVYRRGESILIDGINVRRFRTTGEGGEIITKWRPSRVLVKNVALVDQDTGIPTPIEWKFSQAAADKERYTRVRQASVSGDIIAKPSEAQVQRKIREPHPEKDTPVKYATGRTWIGPWDLFTSEQKEYIIDDAKEKISGVTNIDTQIPELIYSNADEVQDYIRMLPYCPHTFFKIGSCEPYFYDKTPIQQWSKRRLRRNLRSGEGKRVISPELVEQLQDRPTYPKFLTNPIDAHSYWPRVHPDIDPKFKKFNAIQDTNQDNIDNDDIDNDNENQQSTAAAAPK